jgi:hypothetical protein
MNQSGLPKIELAGASASGTPNHTKHHCNYPKSVWCFWGCPRVDSPSLQIFNHEVAVIKVALQKSL